MNNISFYFYLTIVLVLLTGCAWKYLSGNTGHRSHPVPKNNPANAHMNHSDFETLIKRFENPEREKWQKPDVIIQSMGDLKNKTVVEIGSGTGYFTLRLAKAGAHVLACDVDDRFINYLRHRIDTTDISPGNIIPRKVAFDDPMISQETADLALIVNTYHHIDHRSEYFAKVKKGLKQDGILVVIDFKKEETPMGPPKEIRVPPEQVRSELQEAGFSDFDIIVDMLPYQYIVKAGVK